MSLDERIFTALSALFAGRVYPEQAPASVPRPFAVYQPVSTVGSYTLAGSANNDLVRVQVDVYTEDAHPLATHSELAEATRFALEQQLQATLQSLRRTRESETKLRRTTLEIYVRTKPNQP